MIRYWSIVFKLQALLAISEAIDLHCFTRPFDFNHFEVATLDNAELLITSNCLNTTKWTILYLHGFTETMETPTVKGACEALFTADVNLIYVNWDAEAASGSSTFEVVYNYAFRAVPYTISLGNQLGAALVRLILYFGLNKDLIHLVGHSLGAHFAGYAGRYMATQGILVKRITGLDPAGPVYQFPIIVHLDASCADYVVVYHTDPGGYGINQQCGTADVWFNYGMFVNGVKLQPGCGATTDNSVTNDDGYCSHTRSVYYFASALLNQGLFIASNAASYSDWVAQNGTGTDIVYLELNSDMHARGNYYISTTGQAPFGKRVDGLRP